MEGGGGEGQKMALNDKKKCHSVSEGLHLIVVFGTHVENVDISRIFFSFVCSKFRFFGFFKVPQ